MQSLTASTPCKPRNGFAFRSSLSICESFVNYCNLLLQFITILKHDPIMYLSAGELQYQGITESIHYRVDFG